MSKNTYSFDKFMKRFLEDDKLAAEKRNDFGRGNENSPNRRYNRLYRELWQNRIRWGK
tara:strand:+ start:504 stop:677 length:174 start_codon:yes stop_codon:yes gene_type:complete